MIELFAVNIQNININEGMLARVSEKRRQLCGRIKGENAKKLCLAAGLLIVETIGAPEQTDEKGKPYVPGAKPFSISHSGDFAVLARADGAVGVDIERLDRKGELLRAANRAFHPKERDRMLAAADARSEFFKIWTMKESLVKARGTGFDSEPSDFCVFEESIFSFFTPEYFPGYAMAVCSEDKTMRDGITFLEL